MALKIYNTLTRKKDTFKSLKNKKVGMYVCGPTVYDYVHIGNLRAYVFSDIVRRYLIYSNYNVNEVMNLTDVDDKTIKKSQEEKISLKEFTRKYEKAFIENLNEMNIDIPEKMPRATEHINEMIEIIQKLLEKKIAYKTQDGIYFSISKFKKYGKLSKIKKDELKEKATERMKKDEYDKENIQDFALWKFYDESDGDVAWETPFGKGRPGWHIECSAMSIKHLGESFDIHIGGVDLVFPHHENEIAQSEAYSGKQFVNYWMHNEWVLVDGKKMSKSLKNFYRLKDIEEKGFSALTLRYFYLTKLYREKINFTWEVLESSDNSYKRLKNIVSELKENKKEKINEKYLKEFEKAMDDDFNTPNALQVLWKLVRDEKAQGKFQIIKKIDEVLGLKLFEKEEIKIPKEILNLVEQRNTARKNKEWNRADELRNMIKDKGYVIDDTGDEARVRKI